MSNKQTKKTGLSKSLKMFYGVGDFGFTLMSNIESYHFNFFLTNLAQFPLAMVTLITTIASTVDAVLSWMYGAILNSVKPMKWGATVPGWWRFPGWCPSCTRSVY
mgnify:CR=1 FL=1